MTWFYLRGLESFDLYPFSEVVDSSYRRAEPVGFAPMPSDVHNTVRFRKPTNQMSGYAVP